MSWTRLLLLSAALAAAQLDPGLTPHKAPKPSLPRIDQNACPFEGCQFGQWKAREKIQLFSTWKATRKPVRILHKGEAVTAITGTYITLEPSEIQVTAPIPQFGLKPGDLVFGYMNLGEGVFNAWFNGVWVQEFDGSGVHWPSADSGCSRNCNGIGRKPGRFEWWVKIKTKDGVIGWTRDGDKFDGKDALAGQSAEAIIRGDGRTRRASANPSPARNQTDETVTVRGILSRGGKADNVWTLTLDYPLEARDLRGPNPDKTVVLRLLRFVRDSQRPQDRGFDGKHVELRGSLRFPFGLDAAGVTVQTITLLQEDGRAQQLPPRDDSRHSMLRAEMLGVLSPPVAVPIARAQRDCVELPTDPPNDRLEGPHGETLISATCKVTAYENLGGLAWSVARYQWRSIFTAEDRSRGDNARDTVVEEEVVLFEAEGSELHAVWHGRFETGEFAALRSITPEIAQMNDGTTLLSVMSCVNGTGGCGQEFLHQHSDGRWFPVEQKWRDQLPRGFSDRIRHGTRIDPTTLRGEAGFYGDDDPNCCPSQELFVRLALQKDALVLAGQPIVRQSNR